MKVSYIRCFQLNMTCVHLCMCVCVYSTCVSLFASICMPQSAHVPMCLCIWRPEIYIECLPFSLSTLYFEVESLTQQRCSGYSIQFLCGCQGSGLRTSCICSKGFTDWAIILALSFTQFPKYLKLKLCVSVFISICDSLSFSFVELITFVRKYLDCCCFNYLIISSRLVYFYYLLLFKLFIFYKCHMCVQ